MIVLDVYVVYELRNLYERHIMMPLYNNCRYMYITGNKLILYILFCHDIN